MQINFLGQTYSARSKSIDCQRSINFYPEVNPQDSKSVMSLVGTPGLNFFTTAAAIIRGAHIFNGVMFVVAGNTLYSISISGVLSSPLGTLGTSTGRVSMADNGIQSAGVGGNQLCIVDGVAGYIYDVSTSTFSVISSAFPPGGATQVTYIDGYFVVIGTNSMNAFASNLYDGTTWNGLATSPISGAPDFLRAVVNSHQQLFFMKEYTSEIWYDAAVPTTQGFPFARVSGAIIDYGIIAPFTLIRAENTLFWLASQRNNDVGEFVGIAMLNGYQPQIISPPAITYQISQMAAINDAVSYSYSEGGHTFVVFVFPTGNATYAYDTTTGMWHERSSYPGSGLYVIGRHIGDCYCFFNNKHYVSDYRNGNIYEMSSAFLDDNGNPIISTRVAQHIFDKGEYDYAFFSRLQIDMETGGGLPVAGFNQNTCTISIANPAVIVAANHGFNINDAVVFTTTGALPTGLAINTTYYVIAAGYTTGQFEVSAVLGGAAVVTSGSQSGVHSVSTSTDAQIVLSWSDDGGNTWSSDYPASMGKIGNYNARALWRRLGYSRDRVFRISIANRIKKIIVGASVE